MIMASDSEDPISIHLGYIYYIYGMMMVCTRRKEQEV